jgi:hypothetical protein
LLRVLSKIKAVYFRQMIPQIVEDTPLEFAFNDHAFRINSVGGDGDSFKAEGGMSSPLPVFVSEEVDSDLSWTCPLFNSICSSVSHFD